MAFIRLLSVMLLGCPALLQAAGGLEANLASANANPIRKVVTMLQAMQKKVAEEGEKEKALYEKFMCYCRKSGGELTAGISGSEGKISQLGSDIKASEEEKVQVDEDLKQAQADRSSAKDAVAEATAIREKEAAAFSTEKAKLDANIGAIDKAVFAISKGMAGGFLQTNAAVILRNVVTLQQSSLLEEERQQILAFLDGAQRSTYTPQSSQVVGILKEMGDDMRKDLADSTTAEEGAIQSYEELMAAKKKEIAALTAKIESKMTRSGELAVSITQMKNGLSDTEESLLADREFLADLQKGCATKTAEWEEIVKTRAEELTAIAETIKVLNDDDALELFKKTLPSAAASSFVQLRANEAALRKRALSGLLEVRRAGHPDDRVKLDLLVLALGGQKIGFEKVIKMIDQMVETLKQEQVDDDHKKEYCTAQLDMADDKRKELERSVSDRETAMATAKDGISSLEEEIKGLKAGIKDLDKAVMEATEQRKEEHEEFTSSMASNSAAKELLGYAKNRLNKFYNPKLYRPPAKRELSEEDRIAVNMGGTAPPTPAPGGIAGTGIGVFAQIYAHDARRSVEAPPPPPETFGAYTTKKEENMGVIAMINLLIQDLDKQMTEAETEERDAQAEYEGLMRDSAEKRTADSKLLTEKSVTKASLLQDLEAHEEAKGSATKELAATLKYISSLHSECDWLLKYADARKEARSSEIDALGKAKAVLSGADFALLQTRARGFLQHSA